MIPTAPGQPTWIALDIGGANLKAAHASGRARTVPFELWKHPERLAAELARLLATLPPADAVAVTMTGELCDCFRTKADGVETILDAVANATKTRTRCVWGTDGAFHTFEEGVRRPELVAAANWLALASVAARLVPEGPGLLIDVGSTTTDLIPFRDGRVRPQGWTDSGRLRSCELVYAGARRTPLCALATEVDHRCGPIGLAAELFATTLDVYLLRGDIAEDPEDQATADGRPATRDCARDRIARMIAADRDEVSEADALALADAFDAVLVDRLVQAAGRAAPGPERVVVAGSGEFLARRVAGRVVAPGGRIVALADLWDQARSDAGCAHALLVLAQEQPAAGGTS